MNLQVLFGLAFLAGAIGAPSDGCQGPVFKVNGVNYVRELLKNIKSPESLSYDGSTNSLFLTHHDNKPIYSVLAAKINLDTKESEIINDVIYVGEVSVDAKTHNVYIEASGGTYKYNKASNKGELYVESNYTLAPFSKLLFAKNDIVYFSSVPSWTVYKIVNGEVSKFEDLQGTKARNLVIDDDDNIFYTNDDGLYRQKIGSKEAVYYKDSNDLPYQGIAMNKAGDIYASAGFSGVYAVSKSTNEMTKVLAETARSITFDADDNMIYADYEELYRLKPSNDSNCA